MDADVIIRPMRLGDVAAASRLTGARLDEPDRRTLSGRGVAVPGHEQHAAAGRLRLEHLVRHDAGGCWVAEEDGTLVGVAASLTRELMWVLASFVVRPGRRGRGVGGQLLRAALEHGRGCLRGMLAASGDPRAARMYRQAGFTLHPTMELTGEVDRSALPVLERVREGSLADLDLMDSVDRQVRDSAHGVDHELLTSTYRLVVVDRSTGSGYAYVEPEGGPHLLAATNRRTARDLLWETLAATAPGRPCTVGRVTPANEWALDVGLAARLEVHNAGYLGLRHIRTPPWPYLPSAHFL